MEKMLYVDLDGTLLEWREVDYFEQLLEEGYFSSLKSHVNIACALEMLHAEGVPISALSAYPAESPFAVAEKNKTIDTYAGYIPQERRFFCHSSVSKAEWLAEQLGRPLTKNDILLDDYSKNLHEWVAAGGSAIKCMNGINGTNGTWKGPIVCSLEEPHVLVANIGTVLRG